VTRRRSPEQLAAIARDAAERVAKNTGAPVQLCYAPILWALEDAENAPTWSTGRLCAECVAIPALALVLGLVVVWCWP
jgi:hypothetical protein